MDKSLFVSDEIHEHEITLSDGSTHTMYFRELPAGEFRRFAMANESEDEAERLDSMPRLVADCLVTKDGKRALTLEQAKKLKAEPMIAIFNAVQIVNRGDFKKKTASGTS